MREITITSTIKMPTNGEIKTVAKQASPIEPRQATIVTCFVNGYEFENEADKAVYECMKEADAFYKNQIASDVVSAYCEAHGIEWGIIRILSINHYGKHYVIEAVIG